MGRNHMRHLSTRDGCVLAAVADPEPTLVTDAVAKTGAAGFTDALAMVDEADIDALVIAVPTTAHATLALAAIARGLPTLVEKPLAATVAEGIELVAAARARGVPLQVGHVERFNPAVLELGRRLAKGWVGSLYSITSRRAGPFPARIRDVGVTIDLATHDADILSWVAGERPTRVYAETAQRLHASNEDLLFGLFHFPSGATGMLDVNWLTPAKRRQLSVVGELGMFELDYLTQRLTFTSAESAARRSSMVTQRPSGRCRDHRRRRATSHWQPSSTRSWRSLETGDARQSMARMAFGRCRSHPACCRPPPKATLSISPISPAVSPNHDDHRPSDELGERARGRDQAARTIVSPRRRPPGNAMDWRARDSRHCGRGRSRKDGPSVGGPVRLPRLGRHRRGHR